MEVLKKIRKGLDNLLTFLCVFLFAVMVIIRTYQIVVRYFLTVRVQFPKELLTYSFTWMALFSGGSRVWKT